MPVRQLTQDERRIRGIKLASLCRERDRREEQHDEENRAYREELKSLDKEIDALSREVESGFEVLDTQQALFHEAMGGPPEALGEVATPEEEAAGPPTFTCATCGDAVHTTVSFQTGGGTEPTPPVCLKCMKAATGEIVRAKRRSARG